MNEIDKIFEQLQEFIKLAPEVKFSKHEVKKGESSVLSTDSLWKIENEDQKKGGKIEWEKKYRIRHFDSGKYLGIIKSATEKKGMGLKLF